ncbi:hypothetical protein SAMN04515671_2284 [Nakamurella panacisegetis]|uniref:Uncharacterized protein n=1 Tax=Nakamurella panacisegetis TaxID=1090615 RepID=A0A1H0NB97_9ACTN|nr:hypothetical protein SAMN04515671_2284 [Nakamurella panacisegetis]
MDTWTKIYYAIAIAYYVIYILNTVLQFIG